MRPRSFLLLGLLAAGLAASCSLYEPDSVLGDTRVKIVLEDNAVKTRWADGDRVSAFAMDGTRPVSSYIFTAAGRGVETEFFCPTGVVETSDYRFLYPADGSVVMAGDGLRATVPVSQEPVPGELAPGLFLSAGRTGGLDETVRLRPLVSLVRFTLLGGAAGTVTKVTLSGSEPLSGTIVFYDAETLRSAFYDTPGAEANPSNYIQLDGRFSSGGSYYAAAVPGASDMTVLVTLEDAAGRQHTIPVEHVSLRAGEVTDLGTLYLGPSLVESGDLFPLMTATRGPKPIVLMFVPDGFVDGTGANSREEYVKACREGAAYLFNVEPFKSNRDRFTVYVAWKAAAEAGVGTTFGAEVGVWYDNYLGLRAQARQDICDFTEDICPEIREGVTLPRDMGIFLLVNGRQNYGAVCEWSEPESRNEGRFIAVVDYTGAYQYGSLPVGVIPAQWGGNTSTGPLEARTGADGNTYTYTLSETDFRELGYTNYTGSSWGYLGSWKNTLLHEGGGHGVGRLQDEYWFSTTAYTGSTVPGQTMTPPRALNLATDPDKAPWKALLDMREELMARDPRYGRIGNYQGGYAKYFSGVWRPERAGAMNDLRPYFGTWDRALIYQRIMQMSGADPGFDVVGDPADLRTFLDADLAAGGNYDPLRDKTVR